MEPFWPEKATYSKSDPFKVKSSLSLKNNFFSLTSDTFNLKGDQMPDQVASEKNAHLLGHTNFLCPKPAFSGKNNGFSDQNQARSKFELKSHF